MTTISDRLAAALVALEEAATDHTTAPGVLALCTAARAWTRVADEVDGYVDPDSAPINLLDAVIKGRAQAISDYEALRTRTDADIAVLQASLTTAERERDRLLAKLAELEDAATALRGGIIDQDRAWQAATGAATPGDVRVLAADALARAMTKAREDAVRDGNDLDNRISGADLLRHLRADGGPVVLPGATPSTRPAVEAFDLPAINWTERKARYRTDTDGFHAECWWQDEQVGDGAAWTATLVGKADTLDDARATVERARRLLTGTATARPAQTSDGGAHAPAPVAPGDDEVACDACPATDNRATATDSGWALSDEYDAALCPKCHEPASAHVAQPGVDRAEALLLAYHREYKADDEPNAVEAMRRALLAVGAQEPARAVTVGEIVAGIEAEMMKNAECTIRSRDRNDCGRAIARFIGRTVAP